eukprot:GFUD01067669.1.p1 GENE.GFUD01067669.1~~GFUD01067669.1.p1  ORF type:complete len:329 (-),score=92.35 GFUD01067669.1:25-912(-)
MFEDSEAFTEDVIQFPVCVTDDDCKDMSEQADADYRCFQYRCFPWNDQELQGKFRSCKKRSDCVQLGVVEGGDEDDGECFRHQDKRRVNSGICMKRSSSLLCSEHLDCMDSLKCVNGFCGEEKYLQAMNTLQCERHEYCEDLLLGDHCCFDFSSEVFGRKCCDSEGSEGVILPKGELEEDDIVQMNINLDHFQEEGKEDLCLAFPQEVMNKMSNCLSFTTSSPTTVKQSTSTTTAATSSTFFSIVDTPETTEIKENTEKTEDPVKVEEIAAANAAFLNAAISFQVLVVLVLVLLA